MMVAAMAVGLLVDQAASGAMLTVAEGNTVLLGGEYTFDAVEIYGTLQLTGDTDLTVLDTFFLGLTGAGGWFRCRVGQRLGWQPRGARAPG